MSHDAGISSGYALFAEIKVFMGNALDYKNFVLRPRKIQMDYSILIMYGINHQSENG